MRAITAYSFLILLASTANAEGPKLGITFQNAKEAKAALKEQDDPVGKAMPNTGVLVTEVLNENLKDAGLQPLHVIYRINSDSIRNGDDLEEAVSKLRVGDEVKISIKWLSPRNKWVSSAVEFKMTDWKTEKTEEGLASELRGLGLDESIAAIVNKTLGVNSPDSLEESSWIKLFPIGNYKLRVHVQSPVVYLPATGTFHDYTFSRFELFKDGKAMDATEGFYNLDGKPVTAKFESDNPAVFTIEKTKFGWGLKATEAGKGNIKVAFAGEEFLLPLEVKRLPIDGNASTEAVMETFGFPTQKQQHFVRWPSTTSIDGIIYSPKAGSHHAVSHWRWESHPHLVISVEDDKVYEINSYADGKL